VSILRVSLTVIASRPASVVTVATLARCFESKDLKTVIYDTSVERRIEDMHALAARPKKL